MGNQSLISHHTPVNESESECDSLQPVRHRKSSSRSFKWLWNWVSRIKLSSTSSTCTELEIVPIVKEQPSNMLFSGSQSINDSAFVRKHLMKNHQLSTDIPITSSMENLQTATDLDELDRQSTVSDYSRGSHTFEPRVKKLRQLANLRGEFSCVFSREKEISL